ncbi:hypothetical protein A9Q94_08280 [Rhodobacterales bacterium 56_14_T64]|nr:hypothetical protein A9Q94_08280 [Rhodobacterales bacterium 56_14_T64]
MKTKIFTAVSALLLLASPATAQSLRTSEQLTHYAQVQGWTINTVNNTSGRFVGCNAQKTESGQLLTFELYQNNNNWLVSVPTFLHGQPGWGVLSVDKTNFDGQYSYQDNVATKNLSNPEIGYIKGGRVVKIQLSGENMRLWSLAGSGDMMRKTEVCFNNGRVQEIRADRANAGQAAPAQPASQPSVMAADCQTPFTGFYQCTVEGVAAGPGYKEAYRIASSSNQQPHFLFQALTDDDADVWIAYNNGPWEFVGQWEKYGSGECAQPKPNQSAAVQNVLAQGAWNLCVLDK